MSKIVKRVLAMTFAATLLLAGTGWAEEDATEETAPASVDAAPPADAEASEGGEAEEEAKDEAATEE